MAWKAFVSMRRLPVPRRIIVHGNFLPENNYQHKNSQKYCRGNKNAIPMKPPSHLEPARNARSNDKRIGEVALDAAILTEYGKPIIMVTGDDAVCREAKEFLPSVTAVEVKKAAYCYGGALLSPALAEKRIRDGVFTAIDNFKKGIYDFYHTEKPVRFRAEYTERTLLPNAVAKPYMTFIDGRTVEVTGDSVEEALFRLL